MFMDLRIAVIGDRYPDYWTSIAKLWDTPIDLYPRVEASKPTRADGLHACWQAHLNVWEDLRPTIVFEDDAIFAPGNVIPYPKPNWLAEVQSINTEAAMCDPLLIFYGRQFADKAGPGVLWPPRTGVRPMHRVTRLHRICRSHAYYVNATACAALMQVEPMGYSWPLWVGSQLQEPADVDSSNFWSSFKVFATPHAYVGQRAGHSHIADTITPELWWDIERKGC